MNESVTISKEQVAQQSNIVCGMCGHFDTEKKSCPCFKSVESSNFACRYFQPKPRGRKLYINVPKKENKL
jgi:hypothetical protein